MGVDHVFTSARNQIERSLEQNTCRQALAGQSAGPAQSLAPKPTACFTNGDSRSRYGTRLERTVIPTDIDRAAPAVVRIERVIAAAPERVWQLQADVASWPSWQRDVTAATIDGPFATGNTFTWTTAGLAEPIVSTIYSVEANRSVLWGGPSAGIMGIHRWMFDACCPHPRMTRDEKSAPASA